MGEQQEIHYNFAPRVKPFDEESTTSVCVYCCFYQVTIYFLNILGFNILNFKYYLLISRFWIQSEIFSLFLKLNRTRSYKLQQNWISVLRNSAKIRQTSSTDNNNQQETSAPSAPDTMAVETALSTTAHGRLLWTMRSFFSSSNQTSAFGLLSALSLAAPMLPKSVRTRSLLLQVPCRRLANFSNLAWIFRLKVKFEINLKY